MTTWSLWYAIADLNDADWPVKIKEFSAETEISALTIALKKIQTALKRTKKRESEFLVIALFCNQPLTREQMQLDPEAALLYRIKQQYMNRRLLCIKDPLKVFVKGYGPKASVELGKAEQSMYPSLYPDAKTAQS